MWSSFIGFLLSKVFSDSINQLFNTKFLHNSSSLGWFFQDHFKDKYCSTGGKRFIFKENLFVLSFKILGNCVFNSCEFIILFLSSFSIVIILTHKTKKRCLCTKVFSLIYIFFAALKLYLVFGGFFIEKVVEVTLFLSIIMFLTYLFYVLLYFIFSKNLTLIVKFIAHKFCVWSICVILSLNHVFLIIDFEDLLTQNILKEFFLKVVFFFQ